MINFRNVGYSGNVGGAETTVHLTITILLRLGIFGITAIVARIFGLFHVMRAFLTRIHVTESSLQRLGADRQDEYENQEFHVETIK